MKKRTSRHDETEAPGKQAILAAALQLFAAKGIDTASVRDIGTAAGLSNPALFRHFASKEDLALELFERIFREFRPTLPELDARPFAEQLYDVLAAYLAFLDRNLEAALYLQENLRRLWPRMPQALRCQSLIAHMRRLLAAGVEQGVIRREDDHGLLIVVLGGTLGQLARLRYFQEIEAPAAKHLHALHGLLLRTLTSGRKGAAGSFSAKRKRPS